MAPTSKAFNNVVVVLQEHGLNTGERNIDTYMITTDIIFMIPERLRMGWYSMGYRTKPKLSDSRINLFQDMPCAWPFILRFRESAASAYRSISVYSSIHLFDAVNEFWPKSYGRSVRPSGYTNAGQRNAPSLHLLRGSEANEPETVKYLDKCANISYNFWEPGGVCAAFRDSKQNKFNMRMQFVQV